MSNKKSIQFLRTQEVTDDNKNIEVAAGQPFYNSQKNYLGVGGLDGNSKIKDLSPISYRTLKGYFADNAKITNSMKDNDNYYIGPSTTLDNTLDVLNNADGISFKSNNIQIGTNSLDSEFQIKLNDTESSTTNTTIFKNNIFCKDGTLKIDGDPNNNEINISDKLILKNSNGVKIIKNGSYHVDLNDSQINLGYGNNTQLTVENNNIKINNENNCLEINKDATTNNVKVFLNDTINDNIEYEINVENQGTSNNDGADKIEIKTINDGETKTTLKVTNQGSIQLNSQNNCIELQNNNDVNTISILSFEDKVKNYGLEFNNTGYKINNSNWVIEDRIENNNNMMDFSIIDENENNDITTTPLLSFKQDCKDNNGVDNPNINSIYVGESVNKLSLNNNNINLPEELLNLQGFIDWVGTSYLKDAKAANSFQVYSISNATDTFDIKDYSLQIVNSWGDDNIQSSSDCSLNIVLNDQNTTSQSNFQYKWEDNFYVVEYSSSDEITITTPFKDIENNIIINKINDKFLYGNTSVQEIKIPLSVDYIGELAFGDCINLNKVEFYTGKENKYCYCYGGEDGSILTIKESAGLTLGKNAFQNCYKLNNFSLPEDYDNPDEFSFPNTLTAIHSGAFWGCDSLTNIAIPNSVNYIDYEIFGSHVTSTSWTKGEENELGLRSITIPFVGVMTDKDITYRLSDMFQDRTIPSTLTTVTVNGRDIGDYAFEGGTNINTVTLNEGVTYIGRHSFSQLPITSITIPNSVTKIDDFAFLHCNSLGTVEIGKSVRSIGEQTFYNLGSLTDVIFTDGNTEASLETIGSQAFSQCGNLEEITIPKNIITIDNNAFQGCRNLSNVVLGSAIEDAKGNIISVESDLKSIGSYAFESCYYSTNWYKTIAIIPDSVEIIGDCAFMNCIKLKELTIGSGVESWGYNVFGDCTNLEIINISNSVLDNASIFQGCTGVKEINVIGDNLKKVDYNLFSNSSNIETIRIDDLKNWYGIEYNNAYYSDSHPFYKNWSVYDNGNTIYESTSLYLGDNGSALTNIEIKDIDEDEEIKSFAFHSYQKLKSLIINNETNNNISLKDYSFSNCINLNTITLSGNNINISEYAFLGSGNVENGIELTTPGVANQTYEMMYHSDIISKIKSLNITSGDFGTSSINNNGIWSKLETLTFGNGVNGEIGHFQGEFFDCDSLKTIIFDNTNTNEITIRDYLFKDCDGITELNFPNNLKEIKEGAFYSCDMLENISFGSGINTIGSNAFGECASLNTIYIPDIKTWCGITHDIFGDEKTHIMYCDSKPNTKQVYLKEDITEPIVSINIPSEGVIEIKPYSFYNWDWVKSVNLSGGDNGESELKTIGDHAFYKCGGTGVTSLTIPNSVINIGSSAFEGWDNLNTVSLYSIKEVQSQRLKYNITNNNGWNIVDVNTGSDGNNGGNIVKLYPSNVGAYYSGVSETSLKLTISTSIPVLKIKLDVGLLSNDILTLMYNNNIIYENQGDKEYQLQDVKKGDSLEFRYTKNSNYLQNSLFEHINISLQPLQQLNQDYTDCNFKSIFGDKLPENLNTITYNGKDILDNCFNSFENYSSLFSRKHIIFENAEYIGENAFYGYIPGESKEENGESESVRKITIPKNMRYIGNSAFYAPYNNLNNGGVEYLNILNVSNLEYIGDNAFENSSGGGNIIDENYQITLDFSLSNNIKYIGQGAFRDNYCIKGLTFGNFGKSTNLTKIGGMAFYGCGSLSDLDLGEGVKIIGHSAFAYCNKLNNITIPESVEVIQPGAFYNINPKTINFNAINCKDSHNEAYVFYLDPTTNIIDENTNGIELIFGENVEHIPGSMFYSTLIKSVAFNKDGDGKTKVKSIGDFAFWLCNRLTEITIPDSVKTIGNYALADCSNLKEITIPDSVTSIGDGVFSGCSGLTDVTISNNIEEVGGNIFNNCFNNYGSINNVTIPAILCPYINSRNGFSNNTTDNTLNLTITSGDIVNSALQQNNCLKTLTIKGDVKNIGKNAFYLCQYLNTLEIEEGVQTIGDSAFYYCYNNDDNYEKLTTVTIPDSVVSIGNSAFWGCYGLTKVVIGNGVENIDINAFGYCTNLTDLTIGSSVESIGQTAFYECEKLTTVTIPDSVKEIDTMAFYSCGVKEATIPDNVTTLGTGIFSGCGLTKVTTPFVGTSKDSSGTFADIFDSTAYNTLTEVEIKGGIIGNYAFGDNRGTNQAETYSKLEKVAIGKDVTSIGTYAFQNCTNLSTVTIDGVDDNSSQLISIGNRAFQDCSSLTEIIIPDSVTSIGGSAFYDCSSLKEIMIPENVNNLGVAVFANCTNVEKITYNAIGDDIELAWDISTTNYTYGGFGIDPNNYDKVPDDVELIIGSKVTKIPKHLFNTHGDGYHSSISKITFEVNETTGESACKEIGNQAFRNCKRLKSIEIPKGVISLGSEAFQSCNKLESVKILEGVESIGASAFKNCTALTSIELPNTLLQIGGYAFAYCKGLRSIIIPSSVTNIKQSSFSGCSGLEEITLPFVGTENGKGTFGIIFGTDFYTGGSQVSQEYDVSKTHIYYIPNTLKKIKITGGQLPFGAFYGCTKFETIVLENVISIGAKAFYNCTNLTKITIPDSVTSIGNWAFYNCNSLTEISIPDSVTSIGFSVFESCTSLTSVTLPDSVTSIGERAFYGCKALTEIVVPENTMTIGNSAFCLNRSSSDPYSNPYIVKFNAKNCNDLNSGANVFSASKDSDSNMDFKVVVGENVEKIPSYLFTTNVSGGKTIPLTEVTFKGNNVKSIGESAFNKCGKLTTIKIPDSVETIGGYAFNNTGLVDITIGSNVTNIGNSAFHSCNMEDVKIPDKVEYIGSSAFAYCKKLSEVTIGKGVTNIGRYVFRFCSNLTSITYKGTMAEWEDIEKDINWDEGIPATKVTCTDGDVDL